MTRSIYIGSRPLSILPRVEPKDAEEDELVEARERRKRAAAFARQREMLGWNKGKVFQHLAGLGAVELTFDPRPSIVRVPQRWKSQTQLAVTLNASGVAQSDEHGVVAVALLGGRRTKLVVPWSVVFSMIGQEVGGIVWQKDAPPELKEQLAPSAEEPYIIREIGGPDEGRDDDSA